MRNATFEKELQRQGVQWEYLPTVTLDFINVQKSLSNQARLEVVLDDYVVAQYTQAYRNGDEFPPLVLYRPGKGKYVLLDGNQRFAAATAAKLTKHDAYLVLSEDPVALDRIAWSFNNHVNGLRLTREECLSHAVTFVRKYGMTIATAAKEWGVLESAISNRVAILRTRERAAEEGIKLNPAVSDDVLKHIASLDTLGADIFAPAVKAINDTGATVKDAMDLTKKVRTAKTHAAKLAEIQAFASSDAMAQRRAETKGGAIKRRQPLPREQLAKLIADANRLTGQFDRKAFLPASKDETKRMRQSARELCQSLNLIFGLGTIEEAKGDVA